MNTNHIQIFYFVGKEELMTAAYEFEPIEQYDEQSLFIDILYHDGCKRGGNAIRMLLGEPDKDGKPYIRHFASKNPEKLAYSSLQYNAYVTVNTFKSFKRVSEDVFNYTSIFIDLDLHDYKTEAQLQRAIEKTKKRLRGAYKSGELSPATMITSTGRGLGIFYVLKTVICNTENAEKSINYLNEVRAALTAKYKEILSGDGYLEVDTTVKDAARVCRLPLTYNKKAKKWCRLIHVQYNDEDEVVYYSLKELAEQNHLFDEVNELRRQIATNKVVSIDEYRLPFLSVRLKKLSLLQEIREYQCSGKREYMNFIYYCAAVQIYGKEGGAQATKLFNSKFREPLGPEELEHIYHVVDENESPTKDYRGFYKLPDAWVVEKLDVTEEENKICHFGASRKEILRAQAKAKHQEERKKKKADIASYIESYSEMTYAEIADVFDVSERTVKAVAKEYEVGRYNKKTKEISENIEAAAVESKVQNSASESCYAVEDGASSSFELAFSTASVSKSDRIIQAYVDLYASVTSKRKKRKQIPGQMGFRFDSSGNYEYYYIS